MNNMEYCRESFPYMLFSTDMIGYIYIHHKNVKKMRV
jgi:hypothetical protein